MEEEILQKNKKFLIFALGIILICCIGVVSATEDNNDTITMESSSIDEKILNDDIQDTCDSLDAEIDDEKLEQNDLNNLESVGTEVDAGTWSKLRSYAMMEDDDYIITLTGTEYNANSQINFKNSATIIGTDDSYITGGSSSLVPFYSTGDNSLTFLNVKFKNMDASILMRLSTTGVNKFINCSFENIHTYAWQSSVIWNNGGWMTLSGCNFTNCNDGYGVITNHLTYNTVFMSVENCIFENNYGRIEPGAINNCGILNVTNCTFNNNRAGQWAGAIHTHTNAYTKIKGSTFTNNVAGTNGGALYTYSKLEICNSTFSGNNCTTNNGGGAIGAYSFGSTYNITICSCNFINNINLCNALTNVSTTSLGRGGAIGTLNAGYLTICNSNFTNNFARIGQAIAAATYNVDNGTNGTAHLQIYNNRFVDHTGTADTVVIAGNDYLFENNTFINSVQTVIYTGSGNSYNEVTRLYKSSKDLLMSSNSEILKNNDVIVVDNDEILVNDAYDSIDNGGIIYIPAGEYKTFPVFADEKNVTVVGLIGENGEQVIVHKYNKKKGYIPFSAGYYDGDGGKVHYTNRFINITFLSNLILDGDFEFINCTFMGVNFVMSESVKTDVDSRDSLFVPTSFVSIFNNCTFVDSTVEGAYITTYFNKAIFNNCTFENITADSIIYSNTDGGREDGINVYDSTFKEMNVISLIDIPQKYLVNFENNNFDSSVNIYPPEPIATSITLVPTGKGIITITLKDENGNAIENATLTISEAVSPTDVKTDSNGQYILTNIYDGAKVAVNFAGVKYKYSATSAQEGPFDFDLLSKTVVISLENTTSDNKGIVKVTLKNELNEVLAKSNVTYKVNGVEFNATTDENGSFVISDLVGDNEIFVSFAGNDSFNKVNATQKFTFPKEEVKPTPSNTTKPSTPTNTNTPTTKVTKKATKITAKKATFKAKKKTKKYTIVLKAGKAAVKKVKVTLKVGKKTYKATTNSKGKATFKITKLNKKGKYNAVIKFKGNKNFKATSKKVKITVKK